MRAAAADRAVVGRDRTKLEADAREDPHVRVVHLLVRFLEAFVILIKRVRVLHDELAAAHHAEARTDLVAELRLDLVEVHRHLPVALDLVARDVSDDFLVRRPDHEFVLLAILEAQQFGTVLLPAPRFLPQLGGLHGGHQQLDRARPVHLLAHDRLDLADRAQADRQIVIDAAGDAANHAGSHHQLVADDLGVGGCFLQGADKETGGFHANGSMSSGQRGPPEKV